MAEPGHPVQVGVRGGETVARPGAEGEGDAGQAQGSPVVGELVEEDVGRRVVALARVADDSGGRGDQQEQVESRVGGEPVQMGGAVDLGAQYLCEAFGRQLGDHSVGQDSAQCTTPRSGDSSPIRPSSPATAAASAMSQAATSTSAPSAVSSAATSAARGSSGP